MKKIHDDNNLVTAEKQILTVELITDISQLINQAKGYIAQEYNSSQILLNWMIGTRINNEILTDKRAEYGEKVIVKLAEELSLEYGAGYSKPNLFRMIKFAKVFPDKEIVSTLSRQLSWSHFTIICGIDDRLKRDFYSQMCRIQKWSVRDFKKQIDSMLYERTAISKGVKSVIETNIKQLSKSDIISSDMVFKDPYFMDFIGQKNYCNEAELEELILDNITQFLQELGNDFCFIARQKRMSTNNKDRYLDLLFFNRRLRCLIAIDLKIGNFDPAHKGQMEWYLNWLAQNEQLEHENRPLGIILCAGKDQDDIEYLQMDKTNIHIAQYVTKLPEKAKLEKKLYLAIETAKEVYAKKQIKVNEK